MRKLVIGLVMLLIIGGLGVWVYKNKKEVKETIKEKVLVSLKSEKEDKKSTSQSTTRTQEETKGTDTDNLIKEVDSLMSELDQDLSLEEEPEVDFEM